jgi:L-malate glycosyltransferase
MTKDKIQKKHILILNYEFPPLGGGAANATFYLLKEFSKYKNLQIDLVTSSVNKFRIQKFAKNITIHFLDIGKRENLHYQSNKDLLKYSWKAKKYCEDLMKKKKFGLIHAFFGIPCGYIAMKLKNKFAVPYIVSLRGSDVPFYNKRFYWMDKLFFKRMSKKIWKNAKSVVANSKGLKDLALESSPKQKISVIYNGVNTNEFKMSKKNNKKLILISTGRLISRKGYQYLIPALNGLDVELHLIGDGNLTEELKELANQNKVNVKFLGKKTHNELIKYLGKADVFVLPSLNEGMSNSILEAMSCGLPIITTNTGGSEELIKDNGFIVKKGNVEKLRTSMEKFIKEPILIKKMGIKSRKLAEGMSWDKVAREYWGEYGKKTEI